MELPNFTPYMVGILGVCGFLMFLVHYGFSAVKSVARDYLDFRSFIAKEWPTRHHTEVSIGEHKTNVLFWFVVPVRQCSVSFVDVRGIRHTAEVEAESLYEAAVLGIRRLNNDTWIEKIGPATVLDIEVRDPGTKHALSLQQVERWLAGATTNPSEATKKAKLKMMLVKG